MNRRQALTQARQILTEHRIEDASLEGEILLRHVLGIDRARLFAEPDAKISHSREKKLLQYVERRCRGEPTAYITGHKEFFGLDFIVNSHVLIPRPETELLVEKAIDLCRAHPVSTIADIGTGCGNIAISVAVNIPAFKIYGIDISGPALETAAKNRAKYRVQDKVTLLTGNMLEPLPDSVDIIVANLPYIRKADMKPGFEPELALNGGEDGLDKIRILCHQAGKKLNRKGTIILEMGQGQAKAVVASLRRSFPNDPINVEKDLAGIERMVCLRLT